MTQTTPSATLNERLRVIADSLPPYPHASMNMDGGKIVPVPGNDDGDGGGGATAISGGVVYAGGGSLPQKHAGYEDDPEAMFDYLRLEVRDAVGPVRRLPFSGVHVISPRLLAAITERGAFSILEPYLRLAAAGERILPFRMDGSTWVDIGRPEQLERARERLRAPVAQPDFQPDLPGQIVAVGCDIETRGNVRTGSVLIERMTVAGK